MDSFNSHGFQLTTALGEVEFLRVLRVVKAEGVLFHTSKSIALGNAQSDFESVPFSDFEMASQNQVCRCAGVASTRAASDAACKKVNECERKLHEYVVLSNQKISELRGDLDAEMMHFENLNASRVKQETSIATHGVELEELRNKRQMEVDSGDIVARYRWNDRDNYDRFLKDLFYVPFEAAVDCNELQLVANRFVVLIHAMNHVRALGYSMTRDQVLVIYRILHPGDPIDFSSNPDFPCCRLFGKEETDYENFESEFLESSLVTSDEDGTRVGVSNHVFQSSLYGMAKIPGPFKVKAILDVFERNVSS